MAKLTCKYSSINYHCEHLPISLDSRECSHPFFSISQKNLLSLYGKWANQNLTAPESYLLYLSLLNSTALVEFRLPVQFHEKTMQIVSSNMHSLVHIIGKINLTDSPSLHLPAFVISKDTMDLTNSYHWIQAWHTAYNDWYNDRKQSNLKEALKDKLERRQFALEKLIKTESASPIALHTSIAKWADSAGYFPESYTRHPITKQKIKLNEYWQELIIACYSEDKIFNYPKKDLNELLEHCEEELLGEFSDKVAEKSNLFSSTLFKVLRAGMQKQKDYLNLGDISLAGKKTEFKIITQNSNNPTNISDVQIPQKKNYPDTLSYIRAFAAYQAGIASKNIITEEK